MPLVSFTELMADAHRGGYAVGYFESWNLESLLAVADAAERTRSPVILGFSGIYLPHRDRKVQDRLSPYAAIGLETCDALSVPACLLFNESPYFDWVTSALDLGFNLVMYSNESISHDELLERVRKVVARAHSMGAAVEAEIEPLAGVGGDIADSATNLEPALTCPDRAAEFAEATGIDALAVDVGQIHLHGRRTVRLDLERLSELRDRLSVPMVLHGATSIAREDLVSAIRLGIRKINVGSLLKQVYFEALQKACSSVGSWHNPYETVGSGLENDVLIAARLAVQQAVEELMHVFGSAGRARIVERAT